MSVVESRAVPTGLVPFSKLFPGTSRAGLSHAAPTGLGFRLGGGFSASEASCGRAPLLTPFIIEDSAGAAEDAGWRPAGGSRTDQLTSWLSH